MARIDDMTACEVQDSSTTSANANWMKCRSTELPVQENAWTRMPSTEMRLEIS